MVLRFEDVPDGSDLDLEIKFVNEYVKAEIPRKENFPNMSIESFERYHDLVVKHNIHKCSDAENGCQTKFGCKYHFDREETVPTTSKDVRGYWQYRY